MTGRLPGITGIAAGALPGVAMPPASTASPYAMATNPFNSGYSASAWTFSESNMRAVTTGGVDACLCVPKQYGDFCLEFQIITVTGARVGVMDMYTMDKSTGGGSPNYVIYQASTGNVVTGGGAVAYGPTYTSGDVISVIRRSTLGVLYFAKNGVLLGPAATGRSALADVGYISPIASGLDLRVSTTNAYSFNSALQWR